MLEYVGTWGAALVSRRPGRFQPDVQGLNGGIVGHRLQNPLLTIG